MFIDEVDDGFGFVVSDGGQLIEAFGDFAFGFIALSVACFALASFSRLAIDLSVELGDVIVEPVNPVHGIFVLLFHLLELLD